MFSSCGSAGGGGSDPGDTTQDLPKNAAVSVSFSDLDPQGSQIKGSLTITKASDESDVTHYVVYWGSNSVTRFGAPITSLPKTGSNVTYTFAENSPIPESVSHLLVFTKNTIGEMASCISYLIIDFGVPTIPATSMSFTDTDLDGGELQGKVNISVPASEDELTDYVLYWGKNTEEKNSKTPIVTIAKTGSNLIHTFGADTAIPTGATHLLVFTKNVEGEMATGVYAPIIDKGVPANAAVSLGFTDTDPNGQELQGDLIITKASDESDVTHYALYWGSDTTTKTDAQIAEIEKTGENLIYVFPENTAIPISATHLLVFTSNADGEMSTGANLLIVDYGLPTQAATSLSFTDSDLDGGQIQGDVNIGKAFNEADVENYVLYWGKNALEKNSSVSFASVAKTGTDLIHTIPENTTIPADATHILVFTENAEGAMATGPSILIEDKGVPVNQASSIRFTDQDINAKQVQGNVLISMAADENDLTHYVLYWGSNSTTKSGVAITEYAKTGGDITHPFLENTVIPDSVTHLLVYTRNKDGEMATGINHRIVDKIPNYFFLTINKYNGDLGGISGAHAKCLAEYQASYTNLNVDNVRAFIWRAGHDNIFSTLRNHEKIPNKPFYNALPDSYSSGNQLVANSWAHLHSASIYSSFFPDDHLLFESPSRYSWGSAYWSGMERGGLESTNATCSWWTSSHEMAKGASGTPSAINHKWVWTSRDTSCDKKLRLLCIGYNMD